MSSFRQQKLRAPKHHGECLLVPEESSIDSLLESNRTTIDAHQFSIGDQEIHSFRNQAREELLLWARKYTRAYRPECNSELDPENSSFILSGHQPELFHPGVWFKNFVLSEIGQRHQGVAINLIIDNDLCGFNKINVPIGTAKNPSIKRMPFDLGGRNIPFENRQIQDREIFEWFGKRTAQAIGSFVDSPLIDRLWPLVMDAAKSTDHLGNTIAQGRHRLEGQFGLQTLELPLSRVASGRFFLSFACEIIQRLDEFQSAYNQTIRDYRRINGIKSAARPIPELRKLDGYLETPLWIWSKANPIRRPLFVLPQLNQIELTNLKDFSTTVPSGKLLDALRVLGDKFAIRPRALMTTMYSRLILSDLFVHGIGGAKYDELTEVIARRFFGAQIPHHLTATATMKLVDDKTFETGESKSDYRTQLRELDYHAENQVREPDSIQQKLIQRKRDLIRDVVESDNGSRKQWHDEMERVNNSLRGVVEPLRKKILSGLANAQFAERKNRILSSREYSFCLFPDSLPQSLRITE